ncbi:O-antigen ligase family protein [Nodosilinea sp. LEGE 07298]|uniref:O-antigen ligase family protein n=1 Tax=Nodosilinea sp. LEGE 07298 TaxID=2777970 RepID=UPI00188107BF|nr:O-antigen ligase family protein [Nodosilinea sp. LEGE 07298]MBE9113623.1 O-antigen ligase family protein [Nodosilinea sp. LEGE 07298]
MQAQKITLNGNTLASKKEIDFVESCFAVFYLLFIGGFFGFGSDLSETSTIPDSILTLLRYSTYAISLVLLLLRPSETLKTAISNKWALGLVFFISISFLWSPIPQITIDSIWKELLPMFFLSLYLASRFTLKQQFKLVLWAMVLIFLLSIALAIAMPSIGRHTVEPFIGSWKGVFSQKNQFGAHSAMTLIALFMFANYTEKKQRWALILLSTCFAALLVSSSVTALVLSVIGLLLTVFYWRYAWLGKRSILLASLFVLFATSFSYLLFSNWVDILAFLDRDPTLSTRTLIWSLIIGSKIPASPYLGYGRGIFWDSPSLTTGFKFFAYHVPPHAHNGFLDLIIDVGIIGFSLFLVTWFIAYVRAARLAYSRKEASYLWPLLFLSMLTLFNIFESYLARLTSLYWVLFIAIAFSLSPKVLARKTDEF